MSGDTPFIYLVLLSTHLPQPLHLFNPVSIWPASARQPTIALINSSVHWKHNRGHGMVSLCVSILCVCVCLADNAFTLMTLMHQWRRMCVCVYVCMWSMAEDTEGRLRVYDRRSSYLILEGFCRKWKAAFQFYNPVDLISPAVTIHTVQLHGQDRLDEL